MERTVVIDGKEIKWSSSGDLPRLYRNTFGKDLFVQMESFQTRGKKGGSVSLVVDDVELFENLAWAFTKHANPDTPPIDEWLRQFESSQAILKVIPVILEMWVGENKTTSKLKKSKGQ